MNYSSPDYGSIGQEGSYTNMPQQQDPYYNQPLALTEEEKRVLKECAREGIYQRGVPMGVAFGLAGLLGARSGPLMSTKFGVKPAVIGLGLIGYFVGRLSYSKVCIQRVLEVPDGNLKKIMAQKGVIRENIDPSSGQDPSNFYANIDVQKDQDQTWESRKNNSDIGVATTSSFDTVPSDYYAEVDQATDEVKPVNYTSYDDLRKKNRQEFNYRMYPADPQRFEGPDTPRVVRPRVPQAPPTNQPGIQQNKYGDSWE